MPSPGSSSPAVLLPGRRRRWAGAGVAVLLLGPLAACGGQDEDPGTAPVESASPSETASGSASASPSESPTASPSESASESASASPSPTDAAPTGTLRDALLGADEVPGLNEESSWTQGATGAVGTASFGWCSRFDALTIGAREGVQRQFTSAGDRAGQQVLDLVDETNARRAEQVFRGWHRDCRGARVGPIQEITVPSGTAWWYLSNRSGGQGRWEAFGLAQQGERVTVLRMEHTGQDHSYPPGEDPLELAVQAAAAKLG